ncbi:MAG: ferrochelatase [Myxococcota bacterium]
MAEPRAYDAILLVSFGGPEKRADVMPFLERVVAGKRVPKERLLEVAEHYYHFGGKSPINDQNRALIAALEKELALHGPKLPVYWGNRNWDPLLPDTLAKMRDDGVKRALAIFTSAFSSYSGCRQYRENIAKARAEVGEGAPVVDKARAFFNHPGFIEPMVERVREALAQLPEGRRRAARIAFTAHSIPLTMAKHCAYEEQLEEACRLVAEAVGKSEQQLVYQSRSGPPQVPWLEPDILDHMQALRQIGCEDLVLVPIGFVSDHMEVLFDLDEEAQELAEELGMNVVRAGTVGTDPTFVAMLRELIAERTGEVEDRRVLGKLPTKHDVCPADCCLYPVRRGPPPGVGGKPGAGRPAGKPSAG